MPKRRKSAKKIAAGRAAAAQRPRDENGKFIKASAVETEAAPAIRIEATITPIPATPVVPTPELRNRYMETPSESEFESKLSSASGSQSSGSFYRPRSARAAARQIRLHGDKF